MAATAIILALVSLSTPGAPLTSKVVAKQNESFDRYWGTSFEWQFAKLPTEGSIPEDCMPYSGYIYPDRAGGTSNALRKYDQAFHYGQPLATAYERKDTTSYKERALKGPLGFLSRKVTPSWHGHCNGWTAAALRHAEPETTVVRNGVQFHPSDIKALLAEVYIYNDLDHLAGLDEPVNAAVFHAIVANWLGRGSHGLGMEADPGEQKWNYPVYAFASSSAERSDRTVEVKMNLAYMKDTTSEYDESPRLGRFKYFHYMLTLNYAGNIVGGSFYGDSARIDMLWVARRPKPSGTPGNELGNPHLSVEQVLALWRDSVPAEVRSQWLVIEPHPRDRVLNALGGSRLIPLQRSEPSSSGPHVAARRPQPAPPMTPAARAPWSRSDIVPEGENATRESLSDEPRSDAAARQEADTAETATDRAATDRAATDRAATDRAATDRAAADEAATEGAATDRAATDRAATDRAAADEAATEGAANEGAANEEAAEEGPVADEAAEEEDAEGAVAEEPGGDGPAVEAGSTEEATEAVGGRADAATGGAAPVAPGSSRVSISG